MHFVTIIIRLDKDLQSSCKLFMLDSRAHRHCKCFNFVCIELGERRLLPAPKIERVQWEYCRHCPVCRPTYRNVYSIEVKQRQT